MVETMAELKAGDDGQCRMVTIGDDGQWLVIKMAALMAALRAA
jgi:hypothetical protein